MKKLCKKIAFICLILILTFSIACTPKGSVINFSFFNTIIRIQTEGTVINAKTEESILSMLKSLQNSFDEKIQTSITHKFNNATKNQVINLTQMESDIIKYAKECYSFSDEKFNPAIYSLVELWGFNPYIKNQTFIPPTQDKIELALTECDFNSVIFDSENKILTKLDERVKLDFGGIVKGYASEKIAQILTDNGHNKGYVSVGGSSLTILKSQTLGIVHPRKNGNILTINTSDDINLSISTSGDYERFYLDSQSNRYCHIIDPDNGYPTCTGVQSATILGISGFYADALSTALCLKDYSGKENCPLTTFIKKIVIAYPSAEIYVVYNGEKGAKLITNKIQGEDFTLLDNDYTVEKILV